MTKNIYIDRLTWMKRTVTKNSDNGQDEETFTDNGNLWASIQVNSGRRQQDYGTQQTGSDATIRIRNFPTVSALDRLYSAEWEETWEIDTIRRGHDEIICDCFKYDSGAK